MINYIKCKDAVAIYTVILFLRLKLKAHPKIMISNQAKVMSFCEYAHKIHNLLL